MPKKTPFAFVLVKWKGSNAEPITKAHAEHMFTAAGRGTNVVDWFDENTHGNIDMTGNQVFGWIDLAISKDDWAAAGSDRSQLHVATRAAAAAAGLDLSGFTAVVAVTNIGVGVWGGTGNVACSADNGTQPFWAQNIAPSVLCQEMIHGLGVYEHTCRDGSDTPYQDPYDVMSMFIAYAAHASSPSSRAPSSPRCFGTGGPGRSPPNPPTFPSPRSRSPWPSFPSRSSWVASTSSMAGVCGAERRGSGSWASPWRTGTEASPSAPPERPRGSSATFSRERSSGSAIVMVLFGGLGLHDRVAGTRVVRRERL